MVRIIYELSGALCSRCPQSLWYWPRTNNLLLPDVSRRCEMAKIYGQYLAPTILNALLRSSSAYVPGIFPFVGVLPCAVAIAHRHWSVIDSAHTYLLCNLFWRVTVTGKRWFLNIFWYEISIGCRAYYFWHRPTNAMVRMIILVPFDLLLMCTSVNRALMASNIRFVNCNFQINCRHRVPS